jgi:STAS-like domain of unknown function (DUF4325)
VSWSRRGTEHRLRKIERAAWDTNSDPCKGAAPVFACSREAAAHQGTIVELELRMDRPIDLSKASHQRDPMTILESQHWTGDEFVFHIAEEARDLGTREAGGQVRIKILNLVQAEPDERLVLDFSAVSMLSSSFADECVAKLAYEVGRSEFLRRCELRGMTETVSGVVDGSSLHRPVCRAREALLVRSFAGKVSVSLPEGTARAGRSSCDIRPFRTAKSTMSSTSGHLCGRTRSRFSRESPSLDAMCSASLSCR